MKHKKRNPAGIGRAARRCAGGEPRSGSGCPRAGARGRRRSAARAVGPLEVVEREHERPLGARRSASASTAPWQARERGVRRVGVGDRAVAASRRPAREPAAGPGAAARARAGRPSTPSNSWRTTPNGKSRSSRLPRGAARAAGGLGLPAQLGEQAALADARRALDQRRAAVAGVAPPRSGSRAPCARGRGPTRSAAGPRPSDGLAGTPPSRPRPPRAAERRLRGRLVLRAQQPLVQAAQARPGACRARRAAARAASSKTRSASATLPRARSASISASAGGLAERRRLDRGARGVLGLGSSAPPSARGGRGVRLERPDAQVGQLAAPRVDPVGLEPGQQPAGRRSRRRAGRCRGRPRRRAAPQRRPRLGRGPGAPAPSRSRRRRRARAAARPGRRCGPAPSALRSRDSGGASRTLVAGPAPCSGQSARSARRAGPPGRGSATR